MVVVVSIFLALLLLLLPVYSLVQHEPWYRYEQGRLGVYDHVGEEKAQQETGNILSFLEGKGDLSSFTVNEQAHMADVQQLYREGISLFWLLIALVLIGGGILWLLSDLQRARELFVYYGTSVLNLAGLMTLSFVVLAGLAGINFPFLFRIFHETFFPQGNYTFIQDSLLVSLFPLEFFRDFALLIGASAIALALICIIISVLLRKILLGHDERAG